MRRHLLIAALAAMCWAGPALAAAPDFAGMQVQPLQGKPAPSFSLPDLEGKTVRLEDLRGPDSVTIRRPRTGRIADTAPVRKESPTRKRMKEIVHPVLYRDRKGFMQNMQDGFEMYGKLIRELNLKLE